MCIDQSQKSERPCRCYACEKKGIKIRRRARRRKELEFADCAVKRKG